MIGHGITLQVLRVTGPNKSPAEVIFRAGLNVVTGLSDTGKSYILQCIDFVLGAKTSPKSIDEGNGYTAAWLQIRDHQNNIYTLQRSLSGGGIGLYDRPVHEIEHIQPIRTLKATFDANDPNNISTFVLSLSGMQSAKIKRNAQNKTDNLSFRTISHLFIVNEEDIISESSPVEPKNSFEKTKLRHAFKFLLTGRDDSELTESTDPKIAQARRTAKLELFDQLIAELEARLKVQTSESASVTTKLRELESKINQLSNSIGDSSAEIARQQQIRREAWVEHEEANVRISAITEVIARFDLLRQHYQSDLRRLDFTSEGDHYFEQLVPIFCPFCGTALEDHTAQMMCVERQGELVDIQTACKEEASKIAILLRDLEETMNSLAQEREGRVLISQRSAAVIAEAETYITQVLQPKEFTERSELNELQSAYKILAEIEVNSQRLQELREARAVLQKEANNTTSTDRELPETIDTVALRRFCDMVEALLRDWKYPDAGTVEFDQQQMDILINGKPRRNNGKGVRAITRSAFYIALMQYCNSANLPHPLFLVLDSPLTTFKEYKGDMASKDENDDQANDEVSGEIQEAFFENLSRIDEREQIIILENKNPPSRVRWEANVIEFTGRRGVARRGFFPIG